MANTFELISSVTVGSGGAASIDFTSIPATYTDLCVKLSVRTNAGSVGNLFISFNSSTSNFSYRNLSGNGSSAGSSNSTGGLLGAIQGSDYTSNTFTSADIYIPNYAGAAYKSISFDDVTENNATTSYQIMAASLWSNTAAITAIGLTPSSGSFVQYSTAYLYGVKNA